MAGRKILPLSDYNIVFDRSLLTVTEYIQQGSYSSVTILVDEHTQQHCLPALRAALSGITAAEICIPAGEEHKTLQTCEKVWAVLVKNNVDRKGLLINLGGGVIGDLGGFAASCYKRGINFIQVPTTLLAQVDASIGGKLGVDFHFGKNIIGLFRNPGLVVINTGFLDTLPEQQVRNGFAEIFKHALIKDALQWEVLKQLPSLNIPDIEEMVLHSVSIKKKVVEEDPFERNLRKILNFGHTLGHAVEAWSLEHDKIPLLHGEAVVVGMIMEARISTKLANLPEDMLNDIISTLLNYFPFYNLKADEEALWPFLLMDKKNSGDKVLSVLLHAPGEPIVDVPVTKEMIGEVIRYYKSLSGKYGPR